MTKLFVWLAFMSAIVEEAIKGLFHAYEKPDISEDETQPVKVLNNGIELGYSLENIRIYDRALTGDEVKQVVKEMPDTQPVKVRRYTADEIRPKRYPENKPSKLGECYFAHHPTHGGWWSPLYKNNKWGAGYETDWFIDVPNAPEELKPLAYPENKPSRLGAYIIHRTTSDVWMPVNWMSGWCMVFSDCIVEIADVDYFIPYQLESEEE